MEAKKNFNTERKKSQIQVYQPVRSMNIDSLIIPVERFYHLVDDRNKYFYVVFHDLEQWLRGVFDNGPDGANVAFLLVNDTPTFHLVEIEVIAGKLRQQVERQPEVAASQGMSLCRSEFLESDDSLVAIDNDVIDEIGHKLTFLLHEDRVELGVVVGAVDIKKENHLPLVAERLGDFAEMIALFFCHGRQYIRLGFFLHRKITYARMTFIIHKDKCK